MQILFFPFSSVQFLFSVRLHQKKTNIKSGTIGSKFVVLHLGITVCDLCSYIHAFKTQMMLQCESLILRREEDSVFTILTVDSPLWGGFIVRKDSFLEHL